MASSLATAAYMAGPGHRFVRRVIPFRSRASKSFCTGRIPERYLGVSGCGVNRNYIRGVVHRIGGPSSRGEESRPVEKDHADV